MVTLYRKRNFVICGKVEGERLKSEYLIINTKKPFEHGHSHINDYHLAKHIVDLAIGYRIPNKNKKFIIESLIRLSSDKSYINRLRKLTNRYNNA